MERKLDREKKVLNEKQIKNDLKGKLTYEDKVVQKIVGISLESIDGLLTIDGGFFSNLAEKIVNTEDATSGVNVEVGEKEVAVDLDIVAEYGKNISEIYENIQKVIQEKVEQMTNLDVIEINVNVVDIKTKDQHEKDSTSLQDKLGEATESVSEFTSDQVEKAKKMTNKGTQQVKEQLEPRVE
ncbi:Asp23/Gls24 family envelope stress response protein [Enterococcus faecalis]|uniref:Asp23/Gls24 family envelope stress response protein n=1 Tax=Enterococcus TaxID=1350 RepID=UPI001A95B0AB|nr:Asp23/Gls24 family envelope stress response protein [Enterococcus faecalis]MBO1126623.1 Asp23/Gls24 family envelope stress response protein [Enterococcus faecalis]